MGDPSFSAVAATLLALAGIREGEVVVDVGCGSGLLTYAAAAAAGPAGRVFGIDASAASLAAARALRPSSVLWLRADAGRLPFAPASVDKVLCGPADPRSDHPPDLRASLVAWARALVPGGRAVVGAYDAGLADLLREAGLRVTYAAADGDVHYAAATTP